MWKCSACAGIRAIWNRSLELFYRWYFCINSVLTIFFRLFSETEMAVENPGKEKRKKKSTEDIFDWLNQKHNSITSFISVNWPVWGSNQEMTWEPGSGRSPPDLGVSDTWPVTVGGEVSRDRYVPFYLSFSFTSGLGIRMQPAYYCFWNIDFRWYIQTCKWELHCTQKFADLWPISEFWTL